MIQEKRVVGVRIEEAMRADLIVKAKKNDRSLSKEIIARLRRTLEQEVQDEQKQRA